LSIGLISSLKRFEEVIVPKWPFAATSTAAPLATASSGVAKERECSGRRVWRTGGVAQKRSDANGRILVRCVDKKGTSADSGVPLPADECLEREQTNCRIVCASGKAKEGVLALSRVASGIASIWRWSYGLRFE
jgi:hypothetical protein